MADRREKSQLVGDFLREVAVLMVVLYPLEAYLERRFVWWIFAIVVVISGCSLVGGIILEG
jgi:hypothetical protein